MVTFTEEIMLLMLDDDGLFLPIRGGAVEHVLVGAVLMDLAFANRIDTDPEKLQVIDSTPTGNSLLGRPPGAHRQRRRDHEYQGMG